MIINVINAINVSSFQAIRIAFPGLHSSLLAIMHFVSCEGLLLLLLLLLLFIYLKLTKLQKLYMQRKFT